MSYSVEVNRPFGLIIRAGKSDSSLEDVDIEELKLKFHSESLLVLRGYKSFSGSESFAQYCEQWGEVSLWPFGKVLELVEQKDPKDHIFDSNYVPLHWDGMYRPQVPEYQIFHCVKAPLKNGGGRTTFSNTLMALENASVEEKELWRKVTGKYQRKMEFYDSRSVSPIVCPHPYKEYSVIRYNEAPKSVGESERKFLNPPNLRFEGLNDDETEVFHSSLHEALHSPANFYAHEWEDGDVVIADNLTLLHGREAFTANSPRHLQRVHVLSAHSIGNPALESYQ